MEFLEVGQSSAVLAVCCDTGMCASGDPCSCTSCAGSGGGLYDAAGCHRIGDRGTATDSAAVAELAEPVVSRVSVERFGQLVVWRYNEDGVLLSK